jgi:hypothetical protein
MFFPFWYVVPIKIWPPWLKYWPGRWHWGWSLQWQGEEELNSGPVLKIRGWIL